MVKWLVYYIMDNLTYTLCHRLLPFGIHRMVTRNCQNKWEETCGIYSDETSIAPLPDRPTTEPALPDAALLFSLETALGLLVHEETQTRMDCRIAMRRRYGFANRIATSFRRRLDPFIWEWNAIASSMMSNTKWKVTDKATIGETATCGRRTCML